MVAIFKLLSGSSEQATKSSTWQLHLRHNTSASSVAIASKDGRTEPHVGNEPIPFVNIHTVS